MSDTIIVEKYIATRDMWHHHHWEVCGHNRCMIPSLLRSTLPPHTCATNVIEEYVLYIYFHVSFFPFQLLFVDSIFWCFQMSSLGTGLVQIPTLAVLATWEHMRMAGSKCARLSQVLKSQSAVPLTLSGSLCHQPSQHSLAPLYLHNPSSSGLPFTTPNISQTQCALTCIYLHFQTPRDLLAFLPCFWFPLFVDPARKDSHQYTAKTHWTDIISKTLTCHLLLTICFYSVNKPACVSLTWLSLPWFVKNVH